MTGYLWFGFGKEYYYAYVSNTFSVRVGGGILASPPKTGGISELQKECCMQGALPLGPLKTVLLLSLGFMLVSID